jgi:D-beta-D-heptose 7-phosphate kinase/D-beta-D-heptose 1-phosphate adenosyltransferase
VARIVYGFTSGCFDLLHYGHLVYLERCRAHCDRLLVGIDSDAMVRAAKGPERPIIPELERESLVRSLGFVYETILLRSLEEVLDIVRRHGVSLVFKHESFRDIEHVVGVDGTGARLVIIPDIPGLVSTSALIERVLGRYARR